MISQQSNWYKPVVELTRGNIVESYHCGAAAVVDSQGKLVASIGDPQVVTYLRSSAKPFQALPFIESGGAEKYGLTDAEIGLICASHSGTDEHKAAIDNLQAKIGISESDLLCGTHQPFYQPTIEAMILRGEKPTPNRHNCSGKHTGFLAYAKMRGFPFDSYLEHDSQLQKTILTSFSEMCGMDESSVELGVDGCSAPVFAIPLYNAALGFARFSDPAGLNPTRQDACRNIFKGMTGAPNLVAGPDRFDTIFMEVVDGRILTKTGAEGYQIFGIPPQNGKPGMGIALKIADGDVTDRSRGLFGLEILRQLDLITPNELEKMANYFTKKLTNWRKLSIGEIRPCFTLKNS